MGTWEIYIISAGWKSGAGELPLDSLGVSACGGVAAEWDDVGEGCDAWLLCGLSADRRDGLRFRDRALLGRSRV